MPDRDQRYLKDWAELHIGPDQDVSQAEDNEQAGLAKAVFDGIMIMRAHGTSEEKKVNGWGAVSYTHLTLPTKASCTQSLPSILSGFVKASSVGAASRFAQSWLSRGHTLSM